MAEYVSSFITGFQEVVAQDLPNRLKGLKILNLFDGLVHYSYSGNSRDLESVIYFNNTFFVLKTMKGKGLNFPSLAGVVAKENKPYLITKGSFRVRFNQENQFVKVDKQIARKAEDTVLRCTKLQLDRLSPSTEIWYAIRREGFAYCGQLISKREFTEKNLNKGELRPEIAYLICCYADLNQDDVVAEPFCGYGSIPVQLIKKFRFQKLFASDIDKEKISINMQKKQLTDNPQIELSVNDAFVLPQIIDRSVDVVITDPPWGYFEQIDDIGEFYKKMFTSFKRILKENGRMIILSARKDEIEKAALEMNVQILSSLHTLVNGKKASLYKMTF